MVSDGTREPECARIRFRETHTVGSLRKHDIWN